MKKVAYFTNSFFFSHFQERIELFGFATRYHGKWGNSDIYDFDGECGYSRHKNILV